MNLEEATRRVRALRGPSHRPPRLNLHLKAGLRSGNIILRTRSLYIGYPGKTLFTAEDIELHRLETAALIGPNGAGKTTFLKTILGQIPPQQGEVILGASLQIGYFAQAHEGLHPELTLVEEIDAIAPHMLLAEIRDYLARFLFSGEDVFKKVEVLSGGERGRLALAKLALADTNLLLLDEPTNHLDIPSQEILQEVLDAYQGTILLVSHDRYLIDALATQIWDIAEEAGRLRVFTGSYSQYHALQVAEAEAARLAAKEAERRAVAARPARPGDNGGQPAPGLRSSGEERRRRARLKAVEDQIAGLEQQLAAISRRLESPPADPARVQKLGHDYVRLEQELEELMQEWEQIVLPDRPES
jgi:ATP-binding cassette subfamily F protein 3